VWIHTPPRPLPLPPPNMCHGAPPPSLASSTHTSQTSPPSTTPSSPRSSASTASHESHKLLNDFYVAAITPGASPASSVQIPNVATIFSSPFPARASISAPSCSQKRTLLFANYLADHLLLTLPHRQFVFSIPKAPRIFFRHDQKLFAPVSSLIFSMISESYSLTAGKPITSAGVLSFQPFGDLLRANAHWHAIILEGGFDPDGMFFFLPIHDTQKLTECFRRRLIKFFLSKNLISEGFASTLLCWKHSGFSVNNSVRIGAEDHKARIALAQYRPPSHVPCETHLRAFRREGHLPHLLQPRSRREREGLGRLAVHRTRHPVHPSSRRSTYSLLWPVLIRSRWKWPEWDHVAAHAPRAGRSFIHGTDGRRFYGDWKGYGHTTFCERCSGRHRSHRGVWGARTRLYLE